MFIKPEWLLLKFLLTSLFLFYVYVYMLVLPARMPEYGLYTWCLGGGAEEGIRPSETGVTILSYHVAVGNGTWML